MKRSVLFFAVLSLSFTFTSAPAIAQEKPVVAESPILTTGDTWIFKTYLGAREARKFLREEDGLLVFDVTYTAKDGDIFLSFLYLNKDLMDVRLTKRDGTERRRFEPSAMGLRFPLKVGKKWKAKSERIDQGKPGRTFHGSFKVAAVEEVEVPAGKFQSFRVEGQTSDEGQAGLFWLTFWYSPLVNAIVKIKMVDPGMRESTFELIEFRPATKAVRIPGG